MHDTGLPERDERRAADARTTGHRIAQVLRGMRSGAMACAVALGLAAWTAPAAAHKASDAYLRLAADGGLVTQRLDIALRDLDRDLGLDADGDARLTWGEVRRRWGEIEGLARVHVRLQADGRPCSEVGAAAAPALDRHSDGPYAVVQSAWRCEAGAATLSVDYDLFAESDPQHRGIVRFDEAAAPQSSDPGDPGDAGGPTAGTTATAVLGPEAPRARFERAAARVEGGTAAADRVSGVDAFAGPHGALARFGRFVAEGVHHILIGADHVLFLLTLLLPLVRQRAPGTAARAQGPGAPAFAPVLREVLKVVTAFTVAHSITLALAVLDVVAPPARWVESAIAASVVLAALNNLWPLLPHRWGLTFLFGLVHGFGFAGAMQGLALEGGSLVAPLLGFNLGVEIGQALIVAAFLPLAWALRHGRFYARVVLGGGSVAAAVVAAVWLLERAFEITWLAGA